MEEFQIIKEPTNVEDEAIKVKREYNIKDEINEFILRIETQKSCISFILLVTNKKDHIYKTKYALRSLANELELNQNKYSNSKPNFRII